MSLTETTKVGDIDGLDCPTDRNKYKCIGDGSNVGVVHT